MSLDYIMRVKTLGTLVWQQTSLQRGPAVGGGYSNTTTAVKQVAATLDHYVRM